MHPASSCRRSRGKSRLDTGSPPGTAHGTELTRAGRAPPACPGNVGGSPVDLRAGCNGSTATPATIPAVLERSSFEYHLRECVGEFRPVGHVEFMVVRDIARQITAMEAWNEGTARSSGNWPSVYLSLLCRRATRANWKTSPWPRPSRPRRSTSASSTHKSGAAESAAASGHCWNCRQDGIAARPAGGQTLLRTTSYGGGLRGLPQEAVRAGPLQVSALRVLSRALYCRAALLGVCRLQKPRWGCDRYSRGRFAAALAGLVHCHPPVAR